MLLKLKNCIFMYFLPDLAICFCSRSTSMCALLFSLPSYFSQLQLSTQLKVKVKVTLRLLAIYPRHGSHRKRLFYSCVLSHYRGNNVSPELFPSNGCCTVVCLHSCYLAVGLQVTVLSAI
jgi:hypothetical protein